MITVFANSNEDCFLKYYLDARHALYFTPPLNTPSWSLSTEWWMYMIFPFIVPFFANLKMSSKILILLLIAGFYVALKYWIGPIAYSTAPRKPAINLVSDFGFLRCMAGFMLGMGLYGFYATRLFYTVFKNSWVFVVFFAGLLIAMHAGIADLVIIAFFPFILITAAYDTTLEKVLEWRVLQRLDTGKKKILTWRSCRPFIHNSGYWQYCCHV